VLAHRQEWFRVRLGDALAARQVPPREVVDAVAALLDPHALLLPRAPRCSHDGEHLPERRKTRRSAVRTDHEGAVAKLTPA
jgi:hypothetical protein